MILDALPYILLQGMMFGTTLVASRFSVGQYAPTTYIWLRLALASFAHLAFYVVAARRYPWPKDRRVWRHASVLGLAGTAIPMTLLVSALQFQSSGLTSILITAVPAITVLFAHFTLADERLNWVKTIGIFLALSGALLLVARGETGLATIEKANPVGYFLTFIAMIFSAGGTIYARKTLHDANTFDVASIRMFAAALTVMPLSLIFAGFDMSNVDSRGYLALGYAALIGTFIGSWINFFIIKNYSATASSLVAYIIPIFAGLTGWLLLDEKITLGMLAGMALVILGIAVLNRGTPHHPAAA
jgi:drug/metabolite transporter (DMT)-like permease